MDFLVTNGFSPASSANVLFRNRRDGTFEDLTGVIGGGRFDGRGVAFADFDDDGDLDLLSRGLFRNDAPVGNWLKVKLVGGDGQDTFGIGATVEVKAGELRLMRLVSAGVAEGSQKPFELHFGLGENRIYDGITVNWPGGYVDRHPCGRANQRLVLVQGEILEEDCAEDEPDAGSADGGDGVDAGDAAPNDTGPLDGAGGDLGGGTGGGGCGCGNTAGRNIGLALILLFAGMLTKRSGLWRS
jgi:hypothetical protein